MEGMGRGGVWSWNYIEGNASSFTLLGKQYNYQLWVLTLQPETNICLINLNELTI